MLLPEPPPELIVLRPHQERAVDAVRAALRRVRAVLLVMPTGSGKTATASELIRRCVERGKRVLFIVHRREIVRDTARRLRRAGVPCGVVMADEKTPADAMVLVCSVQTLAARGARPPADVIFWDEAHHCAARTYAEIAAAYPGAFHVGLTATPQRADGAGLGDAFDELVVGATVRELVAAGLLVPCDTVAPDRRLDGLAWPVVEAWQQHAADRKTVVFAKHVAHARELVGEFVAAGVPAACVHGGTPKRERDRLLADFDDGALRVLVNVYCLTEGWDCPSAEVCVLARGCGSPGMYIQCIGRVLRPAPGKARALLLDLTGAVHEHGLPDEDRAFALDGDPIKLADGVPPLRTCPACGATFRAKPACPRCGFVFPAPEPPAITLADLRRIGPGATATRDEKLAEWRRLVAACDARGYRPGWAAHKYRARYGTWPPRDFPKFHELTGAEVAS